MKNGRGVTDADIEALLKSKKRGVKKLKFNGDFRSEECIKYLEEADIVVTNPPFSLFREYIAQLIEYKKKFLIIGRETSVASVQPDYPQACLSTYKTMTLRIIHNSKRTTPGIHC